MSPKLHRIPPVVPVAGGIYNGDALNRRPDCVYLRDAILAANTPCTLAVNASWGAGKTVFLKMLQEECRAAEMHCVYFDAWKNDFHPDALAPMIGQIEMQLQERRKLPAKLINAGRKLCPTILVAAASLAAPTTAGVVKETGKKSNAVAEYVARQKAMNKFRCELENFAKPKEDSKPLVFFVDELDRCRPIFAVEVLEKIKHVFDVPGVFFVLAVNKTELQKILRSVYGDIDAATYLRRFFDDEFILENRKSVALAALDRFGAELHRFRDGAHMRDFFPLMCQDFGLQLRDQLQAAALAARALALTPDDFSCSVLVAFFTVLKFANPDLYQRCFASVRLPLDVFPFSDIADYYDSVTGAREFMMKKNKEHPHGFPMLFLCAMHYNNIVDYKREVHSRLNELTSMGRDGVTLSSPEEYEEGFLRKVEGGGRQWAARFTDPRPILERIELGAEKQR